MKLPEGTLLRSRVVDDPGTALADALDRSLTGYAVFEPQDTLLLDSTARGVLTFRDGVPIVGYHTTSDRGGAEAIAELALPGPYRVELYELPAESLRPVHEIDTLRIPPDLPAERLAHDPALADRTRQAAERGSADGCSALEAFLSDEDSIEELRTNARENARMRAEEWGLTEQLAADEESTDLESVVR